MVKVVDKGWDAYIQRMLGCNCYSKVGYPSESTEVEPNGVPVLQVAAVHEFGAPSKNIPIRAHVRTAYDEDVNGLVKRSTMELGRIADGKQTVAQGIARLGLYHENVIKAKIKSGPFAPLKPQTIAKKGSDRPLIDSGQMIQSVTHVEVFE